MIHLSYHGRAAILCGLFLALCATSCRRGRVICGEWRGGDTVLYLSQYSQMGFRVLDSISVRNGEFQWSGFLDEDLLCGLSENPVSRRPASFFLDGDTMRLCVWPGGGITTQHSAINDLLQQTLASQYRADTLFARHADSPVTAYIAARYLTYSLPLDSLSALRQSLTLSGSHPYVRELDETIETIRNVHVGAFAPPVDGVDFNGEDTTLLLFHATWCPDCQREWPLINEYLASHPRTRLAALDIDSVRWDGEAARAYAVRWIPSTFLIHKGKIVKIGY